MSGQNIFHVRSECFVGQVGSHVNEDEEKSEIFDL
jgi:hypothetical protein